MRVIHTPKDGIIEQIISGKVIRITQDLGGSSRNLVYHLETDDGEIILGSQRQDDEVSKLIELIKKLGTEVNAKTQSIKYPLIGLFGYGLFSIGPVLRYWEVVLISKIKNINFEQNNL